MYPDLRAEQARKNMTNAQIAAYLGVSKANYERKKKIGNFKVREIRMLCKLFGKTFEELFQNTVTTDQND